MLRKLHFLSVCCYCACMPYLYLTWLFSCLNRALCNSELLEDVMLCQSLPQNMNIMTILVATESDFRNNCWPPYMYKGFIVPQLSTNEYKSSSNLY
jgi:hypothetical protein